MKTLSENNNDEDYRSTDAYSDQDKVFDTIKVKQVINEGLPKEFITEQTRIASFYRGLDEDNESVLNLLLYVNFYGRAKFEANTDLIKLLDRLYLINPNSCRKVLTHCYLAENLSDGNLSDQSFNLEVNTFLTNVSFNSSFSNKVYPTKIDVYKVIDSAINEYFILQNILVAECCTKYSILQNEYENKYFFGENISRYLNMIEQEITQTELNLYQIRKIKQLKYKSEEIFTEMKSVLKPLKNSINHLTYLYGLDERLTYNHSKYIYGLINIQEPDKFNSDKLDKIRYKAKLKVIATRVAIWIGFGEGSVASAAMTAFLVANFHLNLSVTIPVAVLTLVAGAILNYFLIRDDTYEVLKEIFVNGFMSSLSKLQLFVACIFGSFSLASGFAYGCLQASSLYSSILLPMFTAISMPSNFAHIIAFAITACPVLVTTIGMSSIFFYVIVRMIKSNFHLSLLEYFQDNFTHKGWSCMSKGQFIKEIILSLLELLKISLALAVVLTIMVAGFGVFETRCASILSTIMNSISAVNIAIGVAIVNSVIYLVFDLKKIYQLISMLCENVSSWFSSFYSGVVSKSNASLRAARNWMMFLGGVCILFNCDAQAMLFATQSGPLASLFGRTSSRYLTAFAELSCSAAENGTSYAESQNRFFNIKNICDEKVEGVDYANRI